MIHVCDLSKSFGPRVALDGVSLDVAAGEFVTLVGPNGAGKTTLLRAIAGLEPRATGVVTLDGERLDHLPAHQRGCGLVFQDALLFPHLSVLDNVAFGLRARGLGRSAARRAAQEWLDRVGLSGLAARRPAPLSSVPRFLLLDEPNSALDPGTRASSRRELARHVAGFGGPCLLVTHDAVDAGLADRVIVLEHGRIVQQGSLEEVTARPRSRHVADLAGLNVLRGDATGTSVQLDTGATLTIADPAHGPVLVAVPPHAVALHASPPGGSPRNTAKGTVAHIERIGNRARVQVDGSIPLAAEVTAAALEELGLAPGGTAWVSVKATEIAVAPR